MSLLVGSLVVLVIGYVPGLALTRNKALAVPMAGAVSIVVAGLAGLACVILRTPVLPCAVAMTVVANAVGVALLRRWKTADGPESAPGSGGVGLLTLGSSLLLLAYRPPQPMAWDARSIWWFRASWFQAGGDVVVDSIRNPIMTFGHPEYPPGVPTLIGSVWAISGGEDLRLGMAITTVLTACAVAMLVTTALAGSRVRSPSIVLPILLVAGITLLGEGLAAGGYVDVLCGCLVALAFVGFVGEQRWASLAIAATALTAASLTKVEGLYFAVLLSLLAAIWVERRRLFALVVVVSLTPAIVWLGIVRALNRDLETDVHPSGFAGLVTLDGGRWSRLWDALPDVGQEMWPFLIVAAGTTAGLAVRDAARDAASRAPLRVPLACLGAAVLTTAGMLAVYAAGSLSLEPWLDTSLARVASTPKIFCLLNVALCVDSVRSDPTVEAGVRMRTHGELRADRID